MPKLDGARGTVPAEERSCAMGPAHRGGGRRGGDDGRQVTGEVLREARRSGAKVILAGDDRQLGSHRARRAVYRTAEGARLGGNHRDHAPARSTGSGRRRAIWPTGGSRRRCGVRPEQGGDLDTEAGGAARNAGRAWAKDTATDPAATRFVFAYTNNDVDALNAELRPVRRERGELGEDVGFETKHGEAAFSRRRSGAVHRHAEGRRHLQRQCRHHHRHRSGFGRIGVVLDAAAGREGRQVEWSASEFTGFRHGYAGTIYKGQGKTLDHTYLYHTHHWRAAASYVALTRQRESAQVFVAARRRATCGSSRGRWPRRDQGGLGRLCDGR